MNKLHLDTCKKQLGFADGYGIGESILHPQLCLILCDERDFAKILHDYSADMVTQCLLFLLCLLLALLLPER